MVNPYSRKQLKVGLTESSVDGFVFWTKNLSPFFPVLSEIRTRGFPFVVQYSITSYPRTFESSVVDANRSVENMKRLAEEFGRRVGVWRYDTIVFASNLSADFHRRNFERLASALEGVTDEVVISFAQIYRKTRRNMDIAAEKHDFQWFDPSDEVKCALATELAQIAKARGMQLSICSQKSYLDETIAEARCIDTRRLSEIASRPIRAPQKGNRPECGCHYSRDIGDYDTCPHGCVYCYAVRDKSLAQRRYREHDPEGEFLFPPGENLSPSKISGVQLPLLP